MNHSKKHSSLADQQDRHDGMIQRRTTVRRDELPVVTMFPSAVESLGCEGDGHVEIDQKALNSLPSIPVFCKPTGALDDPAPSPTPAEPEKTAPEPEPAPRFGIWSDGVLALRVKAGFFELEADEFDALVGFLDRVRAGEVS